VPGHRGFPWSAPTGCPSPARVGQQLLRPAVLGHQLLQALGAIGLPDDSTSAPPPAPTGGHVGHCRSQRPHLRSLRVVPGVQPGVQGTGETRSSAWAFSVGGGAGVTEPRDLPSWSQTISGPSWRSPSRCLNNMARRSPKPCGSLTRRPWRPGPDLGRPLRRTGLAGRHAFIPPGSPAHIPLHQYPARSDSTAARPGYRCAPCLVPSHLPFP
jgi:hypothetical protein